jgi:DegV family protein with EDD domain
VPVVPRIGVVTDSTADFPGDARERLGIELVPLSITWDRDSYRDKIDLDIDDFYAMMRTRSTSPTTSAPPAGLFEETYSRMLESVDHVISVHLGSKLSATYDVARSAAERVSPDRITTIDSGQTTMCLGWLAMRAAEMAADGAEPAQIAAELRSWVPRLRLFAVLETLEYAQRSGRIGRAQAFVGGLLNFKPLLSIREGEVHPIERPRTRAAALRRLVDVTASEGTVLKVGVLHGAAPEVADELERLVRERLPGVPIDRGKISIVVGTHAGPGVFGLTALLGD